MPNFRLMKFPGKLLTLLFLLVISVFIHFYSLNEIRVEEGYSTHFSPAFSRFLRYGLGWIPISIGDILYGSLVSWFIWKLFKAISRLWKKTIFQPKPLKDRVLNALVICTSVYIVFNVFWGINYDRQGIATQLGLKMGKYSKEDLVEMNCLLLEKVNASKAVLEKKHIVYPKNRELFEKTGDAYRNIASVYPFLKYDPASIKPSMWGWLGNYTGFTGYYNPFSGEAQVNTTVPKFLQPYIACHEVAHQVGYAKEMEANFVGYLAATSSSDTLFHYSCYLDLFLYTNRNLFLLDSVSAKLSRQELSPSVKTDLQEWIRFNRSHQSFAEPVIRWMYGKYLQGNKQPQGVMSYDEVTAFLIAYYKKFGRI